MTQDLKLHLVETIEEVEDFLRWLGEDRGREFLGVDTETEGLVFKKERVRLVQFGDASEGWAIPFNRWGGLVQTVFDRYRGKYAASNISFDLSRLLYEGIRIPDWSQVHEISIMSFLHDNQEPSRKLKDLSTKYVGIDAHKGERLLQELFRKNNLWWDTVPIDNPIYWQYGALDGVLHSRLASCLYPAAEQYSEAYDLEMAAARVVMNMSISGLQVDLDYTRSTLDKLLLEKEDLVYEVQEGKTTHWYLKGTETRINYADDIIRYFTGMGVPVPTKRTKKGKISVDDDVLAKIPHPDAEKIHRARLIKSWTDNYLNKLLDNEYDGRVHPHINPVGSTTSGRTGRMSMTDPALVTLEKSALIRDCIVSGPEQKFLSVDYQNEELRIIGNICNCSGLIKSFAEGIDMHKSTASKAWGIPVEKVEDWQKQAAKRSMFTWAYGGGEKTFAEYLGDYELGVRIKHSLDQLYPEIRDYIESCKQLIKSNKRDGYGYITMSDGRRLNIPAEKSFQSVSYSSQGEGAIILKKALVSLDAAGLGDYLRLPVHDEIVFEVPESEVEEVAQVAVHMMEDYSHQIPLTCDFEVYERYGDPYRDQEV